MKTKEAVRIRQAVTNAPANQDGKHSTAMKVSVAIVSVIVAIGGIPFIMLVVIVINGK